MDKFEYELKVEQIEKLIRRGDHVTAKKIADGMEWKKEKDTRLLRKVAELYVEFGEEEKALYFLRQAYNASPRGIMILERMIEVALDSDNIDTAVEFCDAYEKVAPNSSEYALFRYRIAVEKKASAQELIRWLKRYTDQEMDEEYAYRLAELYDEIHEKEACLRQCNYIIDFFCFGEYVDKAVALKQKYAELTTYQQRRVDNRETYRQEFATYVKVEDDRAKRQAREDEAERQIREAQMMEQHEAALGEQISEIVEEQEREKQEIHLEGLVQDEILQAEKSLQAETGEALAAEEAQEKPAKSDLWGGISGKLRKNRKLQEEAAQTIAQVTELTPEEEAGMKSAEQELAELEKSLVAELEKEMEKPEKTAEKNIPEEMPILVGKIALDVEDEEPVETPVEETPVEETPVEEVSTEEPTAEEAPAEEAPVEEAPVEAAPIEEAPVEEVPEETVVEEIPEETVVEEEKRFAPEEPEWNMDAETPAAEEAKAEEAPAEEAVVAEVATGAETLAEAEVVAATVAAALEAGNVVKQPFEEGFEAEPILKKKVKKKGKKGKKAMQKPVVEPSEYDELPAEEEVMPETVAEEAAVEAPVEEAPAKTAEESFSESVDLETPEGNFVVACIDEEAGYRYAIEMVRRMEEDLRFETVAKMTARAVNRAKASRVVANMEEDVLLIVQAGELTQASADQLTSWMEKSEDNCVILVDSSQHLADLEKRSPAFMKRFERQYDYEILPTEEWMRLVEDLAKSQNAVLDDAAYQLYIDYLEDHREKNQVIVRQDLEDALMDAVHQASRFSMSGMVSSMLASKYDEDGMLILKDKHFR